MPDITGMLSEFISPKNMRLGESLVAVVVTEGEIQDDPKFGKSLTVGVKVNGVAKTLRLNKTNAALIAEKYGRDSGAWVGKTLTFQVVRTNLEGKSGFQFVG